MPRRKYTPDEGYKASKKQSLAGKFKLGGCLKAEGSTDNAIQNIYVRINEIETLPVTRYESEFYIAPDALQTWLLSCEGRTWAFPRTGPRS